MDTGDLMKQGSERPWLQGQCRKGGDTHWKASEWGTEVCHGPPIGLGIPASRGKRRWLQEDHESAEGIISLVSHKS